MRRFIEALVLLISLNLPSVASATLGGSVDSIENDRSVFSGVKKTAQIQTAYVIHEFDSSGTWVREYASSSGTVFAIAWTGLTHPDLSQLLGRFKADYEEASAQTPRIRGRRHYSVQGHQVVVEMGGHPRQLQGRAYVPALLPPGVTVDAIQ